MRIRAAALALSWLAGAAAAAGEAAGPPALSQAQRCYEALDYACAEARLAEALAAGLKAADQLTARRYQALLAMAYRDEERARQAVRAIFALDPAHRPEGVPPALARIFDAERPPPPPAPRLLGALAVSGVALTGADAARWSEGLGGEAAVGVLLADRFAVTLWGAFHDFRSQVAGFNDLALWSGELRGSVRLPLGPVRLSAGLGLGVGRAGLSSALRDASWWGARLSAPLRLDWPAWEGLGLGLALGPALFVTSTDAGPVASWLWPLSVGFSFGP